MLIYGADRDLGETIHMSDFVTMVDDESWTEFMPKGIGKGLFKKLLKYYDEDVVMGAGLRIRRMAKAADELPPMKRVQRIAEIFNHFRNPDKETVLTPWRVVNLHMSDMLGGWCFYDESFAQPDGLLDEPRLVDRGQVTSDLFRNPDVKILEMNSKSGLYPLYVAYSIYAGKLRDREDKLSLEETQRLWAETLTEHVFVLCKTKMARQITIRTLAGYTGMRVNAVYLTKLLERMRDQKRLANKLSNPRTWDREGERMKFDAIVGNPPYQQNDGGGMGSSATPVYDKFVGMGKECAPRYLSMIMPSRWFAGGRGLDSFRDEMLHDRRIQCIHDYFDGSVLFNCVEIKGGLCYFLWDKEYEGDCCIYSHTEDGKVTQSNRPEDGMNSFIRNSGVISIWRKVQEKHEQPFSSIVSANDPFGYDVRVEGSYRRIKPGYSLDREDGDVAFYYNGWRKDGLGFVKKESVSKGIELVEKPKVFIPKAWGVGNPKTDWLNPFIPERNSVCTETYLVVGPFEGQSEAKNAITYMQTKFFHLMTSIRKITQNTMQSAYTLVPLQDFSKPWTDAELYEKYGLTEDEIAFVERMIKPMA